MLISVSVFFIQDLQDKHEIQEQELKFESVTGEIESTHSY